VNRFWVQRFKVQGSRFKVQGSGFRVQEPVTTAHGKTHTLCTPCPPKLQGRRMLYASYTPPCALHRFLHFNDPNDLNDLNDFNGFNDFYVERLI
jgi:hypothetical protein